MNRNRHRRSASVIPIILAVCACSGQAPAEQAEEPAGTTEKPVAVASPVSVEGSGRADSQKAPATGWCSATEPVLFSCQLKNRKTVSVCGTDSGAGDKMAQYRFGTLGKSPELVWPQAAGTGRLTFASVPYSGGGEAQLGFSRGDVTYVVYSRVVRTNFKAGEPNNPEMTDGIMVLKEKETVSDLVCADSDVIPVDYDLASEYARQSDDAFVIPGE